MSETETLPVEPEVVPAAEPAVESVPEAAPKAEADPVRRAFDELAARPRDEQGRFLPTEKAAEPAPAASTAPKAAAGKPEGEVVPSDGSLAAATHQAAAPISYGALDPVEQTVRQRLAAAGIDFADYTQRLVAADEFLLKDPQKALAWLAQQYGVDLRTLPGSPTSSAPAQPQQVAQPEEAKSQELVQLDAYKAALAQTQEQVQELRNQFENQVRAQHLDTQIKAFAAQTDKYPHFEAAKPRMADLFNKGFAGDLEEAYNVAVWGDANLRAKLKADSEKRWREDTAKRAIAAKRAANINVEPSTPANPAKSKNINDTIASVVHAAYGVH